jgi:hypothetical protein
MARRQRHILAARLGREQAERCDDRTALVPTWLFSLVTTTVGVNSLSGFGLFRARLATRMPQQLW